MKLNRFSDRQLWDLLDDIAFWIKDLEGRFVWVNRTLAEQAKAKREAIIGTLDSDWFLNELAFVYMRDDAEVIQRGRAIINKPELVINPDGAVAWYSTSKYPDYDTAGKVSGTFGMSRPMDPITSLPAEYSDLSLIVNYTRAHIAQGVTVQNLAREAHMSLSTLERTIRRHLRVTPQQLIQRIRMNRAKHLLTASTLKIGEVALECGYESFSAFSRAFKKTYKCAPGSLRDGLLK